MLSQRQLFLIKHIKTFLTVVVIFLVAKSYSQDSTAIFQDLATTKWTICWDMSFSKDFKCEKNIYAEIEFLKNGTYKEDRQLNNTDKHHPYVYGKWELSGNALTIDESDTPTMKVPPRIENIVWLNKDTFYTQGQEGPGGPIVYTYYQRKK